MAFLSDQAMERLRNLEIAPDLSGTRYSLREFIARGGMGAVYLAEDKKLSRRVAIKVLDAADPGGQSADRLEQEARILAELEHPGIVPVHDLGRLADGRVFYAMKFVEGARLDQFLAGLPSLPERLRLVLRICDAVAFAHSRGILHRDLKPANIMVGAFGEVLVMDWGLGKFLPRPSGQSPAGEARASGELAHGGNSQDGVVVGTPGFMSPEQAAGSSSDLDQRSDIFSLGRLLEFVVESPVGGRSAGLPLSRPLRAICDKATSSDRALRYQAVSALSEDISRYLDGAPVSAHRENLGERLLRFYRRYQPAILLIAAYLLMRTLFVIYSRR
jgi:eukaryotic-like serine/threonine-protein kinase